MKRRTGGIILASYTALLSIFALNSMDVEWTDTNIEYLMTNLSLALTLGLLGTMWVIAYALISDQYKLKPRPVVLWAVLFSLIGGFAAIVYQTHLYSDGVYLSPANQIQSICIGATFGGATDSLAGYYRSRTKAHLEEVTRQRDGFKFLNSALRHNILNGINIIDGYAATLAHKEDNNESRELEVIQERSESIATLIDNAETLTEFYSNDVDLQQVNLSDIVRREAALASESFDDASIYVDIEEDIYIEGTPVLRAAFDNLITNAVEHNESTQPQVKISLTRTGSLAEVVIADNGPGMSQDEYEAHLNPGSYTETMGLSIVNKIVQQVNGDLELVDTGSEGAKIRTTFPLVQSVGTTGEESPTPVSGDPSIPTASAVWTDKNGILTHFKRFL
jgi:signal transduction histidine kinase